MRSASVYATLVVAVAIVPVYFLEQVPGAFFPEAATSYLLALLAGLVVSITVTPALAVLILTRKSVAGGESPLVGLLRRGYGKSLPRMISRPAAAAARVSLWCSWPAASRWPRWETRSCRRSRRARCWSAGTPRPGTSLPEMDRLTARAAKELRALPGVTQVGGHVGRAVTADQIVGINSGELWVTISPSADYGRTLDRRSGT